MKLLSVNVAQVGRLSGAMNPDEAGVGAKPQKPILTAIYKQPVSGPVEVGSMGLCGDAQADRSVHGGVDKAVYAYPWEHYDFWRAELSRRLRRNGFPPALPVGTLGENLTLSGAALLESEVWIGDRLSIGTTLLEISMPRQPCFKLAAKLNLPQAPKLMIQSGFSGFYLRVIREGVLRAGDPVELTPGPRQIALKEINDQRRKGSQEDLF